MRHYPKVTVLVPSYNHASFIRQRIESILNQTYKNFRIVVIDDCSADNSDSIIRSLQMQHGFQYLRNAQNAGTPFATWEYIQRHDAGDYIWVSESDDFAEPDFLEVAVNALEIDKSAVLFYCNSWIVDFASNKVDHTDTYFKNYWKDPRWHSDFRATGPTELCKFQLRGQTVPNMSSALIATQAFRNAYTPLLKRFCLTGDWLFIGKVMKQGNVLFSTRTLNNFRRHENTARGQVNSARSQAEFILTIYLLFREAKLPAREFVRFIAPPAARFLRGPPERIDVLKRLLAISWRHTLGCALLFLVSMPLNLAYFRLLADQRSKGKTLM